MFLAELCSTKRISMTRRRDANTRPQNLSTRLKVGLQAVPEISSGWEVARAVSPAKKKRSPRRRALSGSRLLARSRRQA